MKSWYRISDMAGVLCLVYTPAALYVLPAFAFPARKHQGWVARQRPRPTLRQDVAPFGANWRPWHLKLKLSLSQKVGCTAEVVTQSWDVSAPGLSCTRLTDFLPPWQSESAGTLSCNPAQYTYRSWVGGHCYSRILAFSKCEFMIKQLKVHSPALSNF